MRAPRNKGLPGYDDALALRLLMEGSIGRKGEQLRPPMPRFHMTRQDAADVIAFMRSVALEMAPHGITVNAVAPGITNTPMWRGTKSAEEIDRLLQTQNIGEPDEAVGMVLMLLGDDAALVSGQLIMRQARLAR